MDNTAYKELVLKIYQAVSDPAEWVSVMDQISDSVRARGGVILEMFNCGDETVLETPMMTSNYQAEVVNQYFAKHRDAEMRDHLEFDRRLLESDGIEVFDENILYQDRSEYLAQPHVQYLSKIGVAHRTGTLLDKDNPYRARFSLTTSHKRGRLSDQDVRMLKDTLPHLAKALELARPVESRTTEKQGLVALLEALDVGVCLVDAHGRVVEVNGEFRRQREEYGAFFSDSLSRLRLHSAQNQAQLDLLLAGAQNHAKFGARPRKEAILVKTNTDQVSLCLEVVPLPKSDALGNRNFNGALLISRDTSMSVEFDSSLVKQIFELTSTETSVLELVSNGLTNRDIADQRERSVETINAQIKSILLKTGTPNRTQLVRLLCNFSGFKANIAAPSGTKTGWKD